MFSLSPQFVDIFGFVGFAYILTFAWLSLSDKIPPKWMAGILFLIGLIGLIVDGFVIYTFYIK